MVTPMLRPDVFGGLATHAGDALFEVCYLPEFRDDARALRDDYDGSYDAFWEDFRVAPRLLQGAATTTCSTLRAWRPATRPTRTARYASVRPGHGQLIPEVWERWLAWDPVRMVAAPRGRAALAEGDLHRRRQAGRVLPRPRRRGLPARARADRRHRRLLRAVRRDAHGDRVPLPGRAEVPRGTSQLTRACTSAGSGRSCASASPSSSPGSPSSAAASTRPTICSRSSRTRSRYPARTPTARA